MNNDSGEEILNHGLTPIDKDGEETETIKQVQAETDRSFK